MEKSNIGFCGFNGGIGDQVMVSSFPENFYLNYGQKLIDVENKWIFDHNPYVLRGKRPDYVMNHLQRQIEIIKSESRKNWKSDAEEICFNFEVPKCFLRRPRLYKFEDTKTEKDLVVVHTTGRTVGSMSNEVINKIALNYKDYNIIQIGSSKDSDTPFYKKLDLSPWDTAEIISGAAIYIGVNSGFYHVANCYPKVRKKIILDIDQNKLDSFMPKRYTDGLEWYDYNIEYFNKYHFDIGATNTFDII